MTDQQRQDWLSGRWIAIRVTGFTYYVVRRQDRGKVYTRLGTYPNAQKAQKHADKLNTQEATQ